MIRRMTCSLLAVLFGACSPATALKSKGSACMSSTECATGFQCLNGACIDPNNTANNGANDGSSGTGGSTAQTTNDTAPPAPTQLLSRCSAANPAKPTITWQASPGATKYVIYRHPTAFNDRTPIARQESLTPSASVELLPSLTHIRVAAVTGSAEGELSEELVLDGRQRLAFIDANSPRWDLNIVPMTGGAPKVVGPNATNPTRGVNFFSWSPDGTRIAFVSDRDTDDLFELYVAGPDFDGAPVKLSIPLASNEDVSAHRIWWSPNGKELLYRAGDAVNTLDLWKVNVDTGVNTRLVTTGNKKWVHRFRYTPDGTKIVFHADLEIDEHDSLYVMNSDGTNLTTLKAATASENVQHTPFDISPDGTKIVFPWGALDDSTYAFYVMPIAGGPMIAVSGTMTPATGIQHVAQWSPDGTQIAFNANSQNATQERLYVSPASGGTGTAVIGSLARSPATLSATEQVDSFYWSPDGQELMFRVKEDKGGYNLYAGAVASSQTKYAVTQLSPPYWPGLGGYTTDGTRALYMTDTTQDEHYDIYAYGSSTPLVALPVGHSVPWQPAGEFQASPYCFAASTNQRY